MSSKKGLLFDQRSPRFSCGIVTLILVWLTPWATVPAQQSRVHFLGIADTGADGIGPHVKSALENVRNAISSGMPTDRMKEHEAVVGDNCTIDNIMTAVRNVDVSSRDTVVVYYAGHGAFDQTKGTQFMPHNDPDKALQMRVIVETLAKREPRLTVMLIDCCQTPVEGKKVQVYAGPTTEFRLPAKEVPALKQELFFSSPPGTILLFATQRNQPVPCGIPTNGGVLPGTLFAAALEHSFMNVAQAMSWQDFGRIVKRRVDETFAKHKRDSNGNLVLTANQRVAVANQRVWAQWITPQSEVQTIINP